MLPSPSSSSSVTATSSISPSSPPYLGVAGSGTQNVVNGFPVSIFSFFQLSPPGALVYKEGEKITILFGPNLTVSTIPSGWVATGTVREYELSLTGYTQAQAQNAVDLFKVILPASKTSQITVTEYLLNNSATTNLTRRLKEIVPKVTEIKVVTKSSESSVVRDAEYSHRVLPPVDPTIMPASSPSALPFSGQYLRGSQENSSPTVSAGLIIGAGLLVAGVGLLAYLAWGREEPKKPDRTESTAVAAKMKKLEKTTNALLNASQSGRYDYLKQGINLDPTGENAKPVIKAINQCLQEHSVFQKMPGLRVKQEAWSQRQVLELETLKASLEPKPKEEGLFARLSGWWYRPAVEEGAAPEPQVFV